MPTLWVDWQTFKTAPSASWTSRGTSIPPTFHALCKNLSTDLSPSTLAQKDKTVKKEEIRVM